MSKVVTLANIHHGTGNRSDIIYADVYSSDGLMVAATLEYCLQAIKERGWVLAKEPTNDR